MIEIWHNPRCSKSRQTLALLEENGIEPKVRLYLNDTPSAEEIRSVLTLLSAKPADIMRTKDALFKELELKVDASDAILIDAMTKHAALIERPIVIVNNKAAMGRPPESVLDIL
ncbi:arsenate reductase (glutaredoxin) [Pseudohalocynthiibacter aestuariivivens]|jgi:arsenate reductase (glutaredoxin)|uniref:Arsenate reductase n=1 Tax=Pseudohalocynthiibacter aestuariivivens TaxID=1591409 RepID=A0ABV5JD93_9RHOB|nr:MULTISPECIES: arsenate reductase (glutaredoxin) [Pseudohalocynthiibacter]MBS9717091.1 arsenate reductase (glutaredoxin) [Pseudohalocynthiibacter aestuariivivens]MCK0103985.1 arsenate reductase (glutaredoxin) [Pseudohalocynthiibacter sp. F2068]